ncbi:LCP family protein [Promicromonospora citrea]|uniref:Transcriptional regulator n=1 Tax=Promicromonospora citrea TaxID=43677 RepID=A0A8H9GGP9_9MICO|nr:LCP family protein [Promicromonospora citrea]NNH53877.1 LytR family transcriptional regulator [Promicromonospora citrea]GGM25517.1 transcriptional regulator [Promicromonospora citrea]
MATDFWTAVRPVGEVLKGVPRHARTVERQPRHVRSWRKTAVFRGVTMSLVGVMAFGSAAVATAYHTAISQIEVQDLDGLVTEQVKPKDPSDPFKGTPVNLLLMGTDIRDGSNADIGGTVSGMRSDTTMLVHISADRKWIEIVSIPRDTFVDIPSCQRPDGSQTQPYRDKFNASFETGSGGSSLMHAAACTINTVNAITGVTVTNHAVVKMNGVIDVVDAVGGVKMCLPEPLHGDPRSARIDLPAGENRLDGKTAIQFLRVRKGTGMGLELGSDLTRIERQQAFINATLRQILSAETLADPTKTFRLINAALGSLSADPDIADPGKVAGLAWSLREIEKRNIIMTKVPVYDTTEGAASGLGWSPEASEIFARMAADEPPPEVVLPDAAPSASPGASEGAGDGSAGGPEGGSESGDAGGTDGGEGGGEGGSDTPESPDETGSAGETEGTQPASPTPSPSPEVLLEGVCA